MELYQLKTFITVANEAFEKHGLKPVKVTVADQEPVVATLVTSGIGLAIMIEEEAKEHEAAGRMALWNEVVGTIDLNFVYSRRRENEAVVNAAVQSVQAVWKC